MTSAGYYVSTEGNDSNPGTLEKPWRTIQKAANTVKSGDNVYIRGGIYAERVTLQTSGSAGEYITFSNYAGEEVVIDGETVDWGYDWNALVNFNSKHYVKFIGIRVINSRWFGIGSAPDANGCENIVIQDCSTYNTKSSGVAFYRAKNITVDGNSIEQACTGSSNTQECISLANVDTFEISSNHVFNCTNSVEGAGGEGIDVKDGSSNGKIHSNTVNDIAKIGIYIDAYSKYQNDIEVYNNTVYDTVQGIVVAAEKNGTLENVNIHDNTVYGCSTWGFALAAYGSGTTHNMKDITFDHNFTEGNADAGFFLYNKDIENIVITNNVFGGNSSIPILAKDTPLDKVFIDRNTLNRVVAGQPTGTNYTLLK